MSGFRYFALGRRLGVAALALVLGLAVCLWWWDVSIPTHVLGQFDARWVALPEVVTIVSGSIAVAMVAPILPNLEALAGRKARLMSTLAALAVVVASTLTAPLVVWIWGILPPSLIPRGDQYLLPGDHLWDVVPIAGRGATAVVTAAMLGLSLIVVALLGREAGLACTLIAYALLIVAQSHPLGALLPLPGAAGTPLAATPVSVVFAAALVVAGVWTWHRSGASAPLRRRFLG